MIVGYHFLGLIGFWVALIAFVLLNVLLGRLERERAEMEGLRQMMERDELR